MRSEVNAVEFDDWRRLRFSLPHSRLRAPFGNYRIAFENNTSCFLTTKLGDGRFLFFCGPKMELAWKVRNFDWNALQTEEHNECARLIGQQLSVKNNGCNGYPSSSSTLHFLHSSQVAPPEYWKQKMRHF